jgi:hypothetical protein
VRRPVGGDGGALGGAGKGGCAGRSAGQAPGPQHRGVLEPGSFALCAPQSSGVDALARSTPSIGRSPLGSRCCLKSAWVSSGAAA